MGGSSSSQATTEVSTITETTTNTKIGDIGFTGAQAVDMVAVLESGSVQRSRIQADSIKPVVQATGNAWNTLIGGAGHMVQTSAKVAENIVNALPIISQQMLAPSAELAGEMLESTIRVREGPSKFDEMMPYIMFGIAGIGLLIAAKGVL